MPAKWCSVQHNNKKPFSTEHANNLMIIGKTKKALKVSFRYKQIIVFNSWRSINPLY